MTEPNRFAVSNQVVKEGSVEKSNMLPSFSPALREIVDVDYFLRNLGRKLACREPTGFPKESL